MNFFGELLLNLSERTYFVVVGWGRCVSEENLFLN